MGENLKDMKAMSHLKEKKKLARNNQKQKELVVAYNQMQPTVKSVGMNNNN